HVEEISYRWENGSPVFADLFHTSLADLLGTKRNSTEPLTQHHKDIARSVQAMYEEAFFHLLDHLQRRYRLTDIVLAGGCAANSVANGKIRRQTAFKNVYVQSSPGDAGGAIGAACSVWHKLGGKRDFVMNHAF